MATRFVDKSLTVSIGLPKLAAIILGAIGGILQVINYQVVSTGTQTHAIIAAGLYFLIAVGIPPLTGSAFKAIFHLPAWANYLISGGLGTALLVLTSVQMSGSLHVILATVITVASALGFSAAVQPVPVTK